MDKLPVYEMVINPDPESDVEVSYVAFVDKPAIERNFLMFKDQKIRFALNEEKRIVSGPAMVADSLIFRKDDQGEYNVFFSKETISQIALKFFKKDYQKNLNLFHDPNLSLEGVTIFESFVSDKERGIQPMKGFEDLPDGTWFISAKVENDAVWQAIKEGKVRGFSVEGIFSYIKKERPQSGTIKQTSHLLETSFMQDLKELVKTLKQKFFGEAKTEFTLKDNSKVFIDKKEVGGKVMIGDKEAPEGKLEFQDGSSVNVGAGGVISSVTAPVKLMEMTTKDGKVMSMDSMTVGAVCMMDGAPCPPGDYEFTDGSKCTCGQGGIITSVTPAPVSNDPAAQMAALKEMLAGFETKIQGFDAYKTELQTYQTQLAEANAKLKAQGDTIKGIFEIVEKLAALPAGDPAGGNKNTFISQKTKDRDENLKILVSNLKKLKTA